MIQQGEKRFSGTIGEDYDETFKLICPHLEELEESVALGIISSLKDFESGKSLKILDLGAGDGLTSKPILQKIENIDLYAVDNEDLMLSQFEKNLSEYSSKVQIVCEDALVYLRQKEDHFFDAIGSCFVIHNWQQEYRLEVLKEIYRVLRPGGVFVNADKLAEPRPRHEEVFLKQLTLVIDEYTKVGRSDLMREWIVHYLEDNIPGVLWFESEAIDQLKSLGFSEIKNTFRCDLEATLVAVK